MVKKVFILGNHIQALGLARQVRAMGIDAYLFTNTKYSITRYSNSICETFVFHGQNNLLNMILDSHKSGRNTLLFPTNDEMVNFLRVNYSILIDLFYLGIPQPAVVDIFYNKRNTYQFAQKYNIPIPESWFPESISDVENLLKKIEFPVVIKPAIMHSFHKVFGKKAFKCNSGEDLLKRIKYLSGYLPIRELIIQEYLDGGAKTLYSYGTFAVKGNPVVSLIANRIRQNPMDFGNSTTFAKTCFIPEVKETAEKILSLTEYYGLAELEFMFDRKSNQYKFLEVNTRAWKWHSISNALGFSFIGEMILEINQGDYSEIKKSDAKTAWVERLTDYSVIFKELIKGRLSIKEVIRSYRIPKVYAVWSPSDLKPFIMYILLAPILFFKRH